MPLNKLKCFRELLEENAYRLSDSHYMTDFYFEGGAASSLLAAMRDRASTNSVAMRTLALLYPKLLDVGYFSHTLDHVGEHFNTPTLSAFGLAWVSLFSHSPKTRMLWREQTGRSMSSYSATRWWSRWEVYK